MAPSATKPSVKTASSIPTIDQFLQEVGSRTKAAEEAHTEPGSIGGETEHPVKNVDDRTEEAKEGFRSAENTKDVKEDNPASVDATPEAKAAAILGQFSRFAKTEPGAGKKAEDAVSTAGSAKDDQLQIGTKKGPTGDPPNTSDTKPGKEDPGSSHPARTDNDELDGHKYSWDQNTPLDKLASIMSDLGNELCANITWLNQAEKQAQPAAATQPLNPALAQQAGWELAGITNGTFDKKAADAMVQQALEEVIYAGVKQASDVADYLDNYFAGLRAQAQTKRADDMPPPGAGGSEGDMMSAAGMSDAMGGMPPGGGEGGPPPGGGGEGGGSHEQELQQLLALCEQLGITPEELEAYMAQEGGGGGEGGGGPPPGAGGAPPGAVAGGPPPGAGGGMEAQAADRGAAEKFANMKNYITELVKRTRRAA